ncbi:hypothetical protein AAC387_Pa10g0792 [Persea americana]
MIQAGGWVSAHGLYGYAIERERVRGEDGVCACKGSNGEDGCWFREEEEVGCGVVMLVVLRRRGLLALAKETRRMRGLGEERMEMGRFLRMV